MILEADKSKMRILVLTRFFLPQIGGGVVYVQNVCDQLVKHNHSVDVLTRWVKRCEAFDSKQPYRVHRCIEFPRLSSLSTMYQVLRLGYAKRFALVFLGHFMSTHALGVVLLRRLLRIPYVVLIHGNDLRYSMPSRATRLIGLMVLRNATLLLANSQFTANMLIELGATTNRLQVLSPGVDATRFTPVADRQAVQAVRERFGLEGHWVLLTVSRLVSNKGHSAVLGALPIVAEQIPDVLYLIVGDGPWRERLEAQAERLGLLKQVVFAGTVADNLMPVIYHAADVYIMPSRLAPDEFEGFGIAYIEAGACGKPVIGGASGGTSDAVVHGFTGLLVNPDNIEEIAAATIRLLADEAYARTLGENGRRRAEKEFQWNAVGERLDAALRKAVREL